MGQEMTKGHDAITDAGNHDIPMELNENQL
jgi:hypothetical protein